MTLKRDGRRAMSGRVILGTIAAIALLGMAAAIATADWAKGTYPGTTSQGSNLQLQVTKKKVNVVFFEFIAPPCGGVGGLQYAGLEGKIKPSGKFNVPSPGDGFYGYVKGKLKGKKASGTALYHFDAQGCDSGEVTWTAEKD